MNSFKRHALAAATGCILSTGSALAAPWFEPGDRRLREDVELLADAGVIEGPTSVWPLPIAQISRGLAGADRARLNPAQQAALDRVRVWASGLNDTSQLSATVRVTNEPALRRDFSDRAREDFDLSLTAEQRLGNLFLHLQGNFRDGAFEPSGEDDWNIDGTYAALAVGDWALYGGYLDLWWGPSHEASLVMSTNIRPFPKVGVTRLVSDPFTSPWFSWIGPWRFDGFVGVLTGPRSDPYDDPLVAGLRVVFEPLDGLEIGLSRLLQLCGDGRPCGFSTWFDSLVPIGSPDNTGTLDEPGNQAAGYEIRYATAIGEQQAVFYVQGYAEDTLFEVLSLQVGASLTGGSDWGTWRVGVEGVDTYGRTFSKDGFNDRQGGSTYLHFIYRDGLSYRGRPVGFSLDGDSKMVTLTGSLTDLRNRRWYGHLSRADINVTDSPRYRVSDNNEQLWLTEAGVDWPTRIGDVTVEARYQTDSPDTPGFSDSAIQGELRWTTRF